MISRRSLVSTATSVGVISLAGCLTGNEHLVEEEVHNDTESDAECQCSDLIGTIESVRSIPIESVNSGPEDARILFSKQDAKAWLTDRDEFEEATQKEGDDLDDEEEEGQEDEMYYSNSDAELLSHGFEPEPEPPEEEDELLDEVYDDDEKSDYHDYDGESFIEETDFSDSFLVYAHALAPTSCYEFSQPEVSLTSDNEVLSGTMEITPVEDVGICTQAIDSIASLTRVTVGAVSDDLTSIEDITVEWTFIDGWGIEHVFTHTASSEVE